MTSARGYLAIGSALVFCPCHLPIYAAVFGGTVLGTTVSQNFAVLFPLMALYFIGALFVGVRWMTRKEAPACGPCESPGVRSRRGEAVLADSALSAAAEPERNGAEVGAAVGGARWK